MSRVELIQPAQGRLPGAPGSHNPPPDSNPPPDPRMEQRGPVQHEGAWGSAQPWKSGQPHFLRCWCWRWAQPHGSSLCHFSHQLAVTSANLRLTPILVNTPLLSGSVTGSAPAAGSCCVLLVSASRCPAPLGGHCSQLTGA